MDHKKTLHADTKMAFGLTNSKMAFGPTWKLFFGRFWSHIQDLGLKLCSSILTFQGASFGEHGSPYRPHIWRNLWTPKTRKVLKIDPAKMVENRWIWFEMASENSIWGMETWIRLQILIRMHWQWFRTPKTVFLTPKYRKWRKTEKEIGLHADFKLPLF